MRLIKGEYPTYHCQSSRLTYACKVLQAYCKAVMSLIYSDDTSIAPPLKSACDIKHDTDKHFKIIISKQ